MADFSDILLASDFDHTLTDLNDRIPPQNLEAIHYFMEKGGIFTVASGRGIPLFREKAKLVPVNAPCILSNGAVRYDYRSETLSHVEPMLPEFARRVAAAVRAYDSSLCLEVQCLDCHYIYGSNPGRDAFLARSGIRAAHVENDPPAPWLKLVVCAAEGNVLETYDEVPREKLAAFDRLIAYLERFCSGRCYVARSMPRVVEIGSLSASKGAAARALARELGRRRLVCVGDAMNDVSMLQAADLAFCPADCDPALRDAPYCRLTVPCGDGAIAAVIAALDAK